MISTMLQKATPSKRDRQAIDLFFIFPIYVKENEYTCTHKSLLDRISSSSNYSSKQAIDGVPNEVKEKLKDLKEVAEGDAKPERETTT